MAELIYAGDGGAFKVCGTCRETKFVSEFARRKSAIDGLRNACKACENAPRRDGEPIGAAIRCERCRIDMVKTGPGLRFCDDCIRERNNERTLSTYYQKRESLGVIPIGSTIQCVDCGTDIIRTGSKVTRCAGCYKFKRDNRHYLESGREPAHEPLGATASCEQCKRIFTKSAINKKYCCIECYKMADTGARKSRYERHREKQKVDPHYIISSRMASGIRMSLKNGKGGRSWECLVGYTREQLADSIERQFLPGMSWDNMSEWHIDHIVPKSSFKYETCDCDEFRAAWAITNLRPLWAKDNLKKHAKLLYLV